MEDLNFLYRGQQLELMRADDSDCPITSAAHRARARHYDDRIYATRLASGAVDRVSTLG